MVLRIYLNVEGTLCHGFSLVKGHAHGAAETCRAHEETEHMNHRLLDVVTFRDRSCNHLVVERSLGAVETVALPSNGPHPFVGCETCDDSLESGFVDETSEL